LVFVMAIGLFLAAPWHAVFAQADGPTDDEVNAIAKELYCPVCENVPLDVCGTQACAQWRSLIRERLEQGWTEQEIKNYFVAQYGDRVLATPPARGLNWLVYVLPPVAIAAGAGILFRAIRKWRLPASEPDTAEPMSSAGDDPYIARLQEQLAARQGEGSTEEENDG
jgi:cytochrome c-type biogenesis protein CcmH